MGARTEGLSLVIVTMTGSTETLKLSLAAYLNCHLTKYQAVLVL